MFLRRCGGAACTSASRAADYLSLKSLIAAAAAGAVSELLSSLLRRRLQSAPLRPPHNTSIDKEEEASFK